MRTIVAPRLRPIPLDDPPSTTLDPVDVTAPAPTAAQGEGDFGGGGDLTPQPDAGGSGTQAPTLYGNWTPALFMPHQRSIGGIIAEVTIEETGTDDLVITEHPVEQGAPIADHSFKRPSTVTIRAGWSVRGSYDLSAESGVYGLLLSWQAALQPFDVVTGKRKYTSMLMERLTVHTDQKSEYALMADIVCRQVIIVNTSTSTNQTGSDSPANQANPEETSSSADSGDQNPKDAGDGGQLVPQPYPDQPGTYRPPEGGDDSVLQPEGQKVESTVTGQPVGRDPTTDSPMIGPGRTPDPGSTAAQPGNASMSQINEKGLTTRTDAAGNFLSVSAPLAPPKSGPQWQEMSRYLADRAVRSPNASPYWGSSTR